MPQNKNTPDWITAICTFVIMLTGIGALLYAHWQIKQIHEEAQVEHLLKEIDLFEQEPMISYRKLYAQERLKEISDPASEYHLLDFFETVGELADDGYLKEEDVWENFSSDIEPLYSDTHIMIESLNDPTYYNHFVSLSKRMMDIDKAKGANTSPYDKKALQGYWQEESAIIAGVPTTHLKNRHSK